MAQRRSSSRVDGREGVGTEKKRKGGTHRYRTPIGVLVVFVAAAVGVWIGAAFNPRKSHALPARAQREIRNNRTFEGSRGPWGQL